MKDKINSNQNQFTVNDVQIQEDEEKIDGG